MKFERIIYLWHPVTVCVLVLSLCCWFCGHFESGLWFVWGTIFNHHQRQVALPPTRSVVATWTHRLRRTEPAHRWEVIEPRLLGRVGPETHQLLFETPLQGHLVTRVYPSSGWVWMFQSNGFSASRRGQVPCTVTIKAALAWWQWSGGRGMDIKLLERRLVGVPSVQHHLRLDRLPMRAGALYLSWQCSPTCQTCLVLGLEGL